MDVSYDHKNYITDNFSRLSLLDQKRILREHIIANNLASMVLRDNGTDLTIRLEVITDAVIIKNMYMAIRGLCSKL